MPQVINSSGSLNDRFNILADHSLLEIESLQSILQSITIKESISLEDGIFQINDDVYTTDIKPKDTKLKGLVDSISKDENEENGASYLNYLDMPNVDLPLFETKKKNKRVDVKEESESLLFLENGFNYDNFRSHFKKTNIGIVQSLMKISQHLGAVFAGLLVLDNNEWRLDHSLGFNQKTIDDFIFQETDDFSRDVFNQKKFLLFKKGISGIEEIDSKIYDGDMSYINGSLFIPVVFKGMSAYLILGMKITKSIQEYVKILQKV